MRAHSVNVTMLTYPKNLEGSITVIGEKGTVRVGGVAVNRIDHWEFAEADPDGVPELHRSLGLRGRAPQKAGDDPSSQNQPRIRKKRTSTNSPATITPKMPPTVYDVL